MTLEQATVAIFTAAAFTLVPAPAAAGGDGTLNRGSTPAVMPRGEVIADKALVYLIRQPNRTLNLRTAFVYADREFLGTVDDDSYAIAYVEPGHRLIWTNWTRLANEFDFIAGKTYVLEVIPSLTLHDTERGLALLDTLHEYKTSSAEERATAAGHVQNRYERAVRAAAEEVVEPQDTPAAALTASSAPPGAVLVPAGTTVKVELLENVQSELSRAGETIWFRVAEDVLLEGHVLARKGTLVAGFVRRVEVSRKFMGLGGTLDIAIATLIAADGTPVPVSARVMARARDKTMKEILVAGATFGSPMGQAFAMAGDVYAAETTASAWFVPTTESGPGPGSASPVSSKAVVLEAFGPSIVFDAQTDSLDEPLRFGVKSDRALSDVSIVSVGDILLSEPIKATKLKKVGTIYQCPFPAWSVIRYVRLGTTEGTSFRLIGKRAGDESFVADAIVTGRLKP